MKILHITASLGLGGAENLLCELASWQKTNGYDVHVISLRNDEALVNKLENQGIKVYLALHSRLWLATNAFYLLALILKWPGVCLRVKTIRPDVIHTWLYLADIYGGLIGFLLGRPIVWGVFSGSTNRRFYSFLSYFMMRLCVVLSWVIPKRVISCSAYGRRSHSQIGYRKKRIVFVPTGFVRSTYKNVKTQNRLDQSYMTTNTTTLGMLGRVSLEKDHITLIKAISELTKHNYDLRLVLAGGTGLDKATSPLMPLVVEYKLEHRVEFMGAVNDVDEFFRKLDIFALISKSEGFPTVVGEAMVRGLPCVVSKVGDAHILVGDKAQIVEENDVYGVVKTIRDLLNMSPSEQNKIRFRNQQRIQHLFSQAKMFERYDKVYKQIVQQA